MDTTLAPSIFVGSFLKDRKTVAATETMLRAMFVAAGVPESDVRIDIPGRDMSRDADLRGVADMSNLGQDPFAAFDALRPDAIEWETFGPDRPSATEIFNEPGFLETMNAQQAALKATLGGSRSLTGVEETVAVVGLVVAVGSLAVAASSLGVSILGLGYTIYADQRDRKEREEEKAKQEAQALEFAQQTEGKNGASSGVIAMERDDNNNGVPDDIEEFGPLMVSLRNAIASDGPMPTALRSVHLSISEARDGLAVSARIAANGTDVTTAMLLRG